MNDDENDGGGASALTELASAVASVCGELARLDEALRELNAALSGIQDQEGSA